MSRDELTELSQRIGAHPAFEAACQRYVDDYLDWRDRLGMLNKVVANDARLLILDNLIYLHFAGEVEGGPGATFERLTELSGLTDDVGARAVRTLLRLAQIGGLIVPGRDPTDGRLRVYQPTASLIEKSRDYTVLTMRPLDAMFPQERIVERIADEPGFFEDAVVRHGRFLLQMRPQMPRTGAQFRNIMRLEGARQIYCVVLHCAFHARNLPPAIELSRRFLISQSQARAVLKAAEMQGLIKTGPRGRLIDATPLMQAIFHRYARILAFAVKYTFAIEPSAVDY